MPSLTGPLFIAYLVCCPLLFSHTPPTAYPLQVTLPFLVILLCRIYSLGEKTKRPLALRGSSFSSLSRWGANTPSCSRLVCFWSNTLSAMRSI